MGYGYALFENATDGMLLHKGLKNAGVRADICPTPRHLSKSCGIALRFDVPLAERVRQIADALVVPVEIVGIPGVSAKDSDV